MTSPASHALPSSSPVSWLLRSSQASALSSSEAGGSGAPRPELGLVGLRSHGQASALSSPPALLARAAARPHQPPLNAIARKRPGSRSGDQTPRSPVASGALGGTSIDRPPGLSVRASAASLRRRGCRARKATGWGCCLFKKGRNSGCLPFRSHRLQPLQFSGGNAFW